jgi:hypothetical protein
MSIKRLHEGFGVGEDSCISGIHPMRASDPPGVYLGNNPESLSKGLYITYWEADEIAQKIGFPHIGVYEEQKRLIDQQAREIEDLKQQLNEEINTLQLKSIHTAIKNGNKDVLNAVEGYSAAVRARVAVAGKAAGSSASKSAGGTAKPVL